MKTMKIMFLFLLLSVIYGDATYTETFDLKVTITNINTLKVTIEMGVYYNSKPLLQQGKEYNAYSIEVTSDTVFILLKDFKKDSYAFAIYHDINSDKECNLSFFGIPKEPYAFSKNYRPLLSKPSFNDCKISLHQDMSIVIDLLD